jgi:hypothetical protein
MKRFLSLSLLIVLFNCYNGTDESTYAPSSYDNLENYELEEKVSASDFVKPQKQSLNPDNSEIAQKIIKTSNLTFETKNLDKTFEEISGFVKQYKGFIQSDESFKGYNKVSRRLTIRIPAEGFQPTLDSIAKSVSFFDEKSISQRDVTEEFVDLEARLKAKRELENRYLQLLSKAKNVKEMLEIERELSNIREEIEAKQGRLKYLQNKVSYSTINIEFYRLIPNETGVTIGYGTKMWNAFKSGFNGLSSFILGLLSIWPFLIIIVLIVYWVRRKFIKRKAS